MDFRKLAGVIALVYGASAWAGQPFVVKDIRIEGIQRTEAGTVFSYLPVKVGDTLDDDRATSALHALFSTGFNSMSGCSRILVSRQREISSREANRIFILIFNLRENVY